MLEVILKRMDALSKLGNTTDAHRLEELSSALDRIQPIGLVERIQAIAQNMSDMAVKVEQILQRSISTNKVREGVFGQCETPKDPRYPDCSSKMDWMRARWTSDPCYAFYGVDGSDCSFLVYLSEVEWFCPPLAWRNHTATPAPKPLPRIQAVFQSDIGGLMEQVGTGKESLSFMKRRMRRLASQWASAARRLDDKLRNQWRGQKRILVHVGFLTEESGDVFSPKVLKGGPLGEMVQWADILTALHVLGHNLKISVSLKELHGASLFSPAIGRAEISYLCFLRRAAPAQRLGGISRICAARSCRSSPTRSDNPVGGAKTEQPGPSNNAHAIERCRTPPPQGGCRFLGVPPGRGSCPLTGSLPFDLIYTDYHGLQQMKQHMGLSLRKYKCHIRVIDTFGTEPAYNHEEYATLHGYRTNWGYWNLHGQQYMTMFRM
ncbi:Alpha-1,6-mannosylglycoprotein 6-beta-N-acetylglucosaminyltransferase B [Takifugu flavidus]|uniref:alpha-1,6-mannosyl-glycoprotein 6-beta-N-acetylglucosaminyltransferase n=1 Tax=Takifugu flavidus TaxID=433684 RepID=A0A5C6NU35_9TELE|nr:Alpha-1,6-mannosylglycoprotein 6-beta-N-acetylglucosaminyltransferase B [Takifugu flavidus]